jgi:hypothetical protein
MLAADPANVPASLAMIAIATDAQRSELVNEHKQMLASRLRELEPQAVAQRDEVVCAQIATFHLDVELDPHRALEFARLVAEREPDSPVALALLGRALAETGQPAEAAPVLERVAGSDQRAALSLASVLRSQERIAEAAAALQRAARLRMAGRDYARISAELRELHAEAPQPPDAATMRAVLADLNPALLEFDVNPADALHYEAWLLADKLTLGAPVRAEITLSNTAEFPVSVGQNRMAPAKVAVSMRGSHDSASARIGYLTLDLNERLLLPSGERTSRSVSLDTLPAQALLYRQPQREMEIEFTFTPDPVLSADGKINCGLAGIDPITRRCTRLAVNASPEGQARLAAQLRTGSEPQRLVAIDIMLALIFERNEVQAGKTQPYPMAHVDAAHLVRLLRVALSDTSPLVRARGLCALSYLPLDEETIGAAAPLLSDRHFLPRLLACELFARQQGALFLPVLERLTADSDPLIARLAGLYRAALAQPPAPAPSPS